jgi:hypothetical protein
MALRGQYPGGEKKLWLYPANLTYSTVVKGWKIRELGFSKPNFELLPKRTDRLTV